jgi:hypothetical protein
VTILDGRPALARVGADHLVHVTESFDAGVPFLVWADVANWQTEDMPELPTYAEVERFVGQAGAKAGLTRAFPFVIRGRPELIDFHIVNARSDTPPGMPAHQKIQIPFELRGEDAKLVGSGRASIKASSRRWERTSIPTFRRWTIRSQAMYRASGLDRA